MTPPLQEIPLLAGMGAAELTRAEHFLAPFEAEAGEALFAQGEQADRMFLLEAGSVEIEVERVAGERTTLATVGERELLGEMSLLGGSRRTGTAIVRERVTGWVLHRSSWEMLRLHSGEGAVELVARMTELALERLRGRYAEIERELRAIDPADGPAPPCDAPSAAEPSVASEEYVESLLCFRHFRERGEVASVLAGAAPVELPPGGVILQAAVVPPDLVLVLRGAIDVSIRRRDVSQRVRLAGPGRYVGLTGALDGRPSPVGARARTRAILLALPAARVRSMLRDPSPPARRFSAGLADDIGRALRQAERSVPTITTDRPETRP